VTSLFVVSWGHPYDWLLAISGLSCLLAIAFFRWRG
jgi:hypothetical protein